LYQKAQSKLFARALHYAAIACHTRPVTSIQFVEFARGCAIVLAEDSGKTLYWDQDSGDILPKDWQSHQGAKVAREVEGLASLFPDGRAFGNFHPRVNKSRDLVYLTQTAHISHESSDDSDNPYSADNAPLLDFAVAWFKAPSPLLCMDICDLKFVAGCQSGKVLVCSLLNSEIDRHYDFKMKEESADAHDRIVVTNRPVMSQPVTMKTRPKPSLSHFLDRFGSFSRRPWDLSRQKLQSRGQSGSVGGILRESTPGGGKRLTSSVQIATFDDDGETIDFSSREGNAFQSQKYTEAQWYGGVELEFTGEICRPQYEASAHHDRRPIQGEGICQLYNTIQPKKSADGAKGGVAPSRVHSVFNS